MERDTLNRVLAESQNRIIGKKKKCPGHNHNQDRWKTDHCRRLIILGPLRSESKQREQSGCGDVRWAQRKRDDDLRIADELGGKRKLERRHTSFRARRNSQRQKKHVARATTGRLQ
jgi:hypothetical protein